MATMKALFADDVTCHIAGRNKWSGHYTGPGSVVECMTGVAGEANIDT